MGNLPVSGRVILMRGAILIPLALAVHLGLAPTALAEEALVKGMGRTVGWLVAADDGSLRFRDCQGQTSPVENARIEATAERCAGGSRSIDLVGTVRRLDGVARVVIIETPDRQLHSFYVDTGRLDAPALAGLAPGQSVRVTGPIAGRATGLSPQ